jgi:alpha-aminoadipate carrier protein LysW
MTFAECISCGTEIKFSAQPKMGHLVTCPDCSADLEVVWLDPVELDWPYDEEDFEEDEEYYYEEEDY